MLEETGLYMGIQFGDFNCDQMLQEIADAFQQLCEYSNFTQRVTYSTFIHGGILDLGCDQKRTEAV